MKSKQVSKSDLGKEWPLKVSSGLLVRDGMAVFFQSNGKKYAVNGLASNMGGADISPIWRNASCCGEAKMNIVPLVELGLSL